MMCLKSGMQSDWMQCQVDDKFEKLLYGETPLIQRQEEQCIDCDCNRWCGTRPANCRCCLVLLVIALYVIVAGLFLWMLLLLQW